MFLCPGCVAPLHRASVPGGLAWVCLACQGRAITLPVLRRLVDPVVLKQLWNRTLAALVVSDRGCPACRRRMLEVVADTAEQRVPLDVCRQCHLVWFDAAEFEQMPVRTGPPAADHAWEPPIPDQHRADGSFRGRQRPSDHGVTDLRLVPALLGMPVELHDTEISSRPIGTWILAVTITVVSTVALLDPVWVERFALVPDRLWRHGGATLLTAFFLHGSWWHLVGNLYFFVVFGDNVEDYLGWRRWLLLVSGATLAGAMMHTLGEPNSTMPCVGASGGISGLIAFYALRFPRARLGSYLWFLFVPHWITYPAWGGFLFWVLAQAVLLAQQLSGFGNVSALAHVGGALVGGVAWWCWRDLRTT